MDRKIACLAVISALYVTAILGTAPNSVPALTSYEWTETFEQGGISGWSSYPPFEDTAFDFTILPGHYRPRYQLQGYVASGEFLYPVGLAPPSHPKGNRYYLLRSYRPNSASAQKIGFTRKISLYAAEDSQFSFDYWLKLTASPADVLVELAGADGNVYTHRISGVKPEQWQSTRIPLASFGSESLRLPVGLEIQAVAISAHLERGDAGVVHHFAVDNVAWRGERQAGFRILSPETRSYKNWKLDFSQRHYRPGDPLDLEVKAEIEDLKEVKARLEYFDGNTIASELPLTKKGKLWSGIGLYRFSDRDPRGPWSLVLEGTTQFGEVARTVVRLWLLDRVQGARYPRLFFTEDDRQRLVERSRSGRGKEIWDNLAKEAEKARQKGTEMELGYAANVPVDPQLEYFQEDYFMPTYRIWLNALRPPAHGAMLNALVYFVTRDQQAGQFARDTLIKMSNWGQWIHPWFKTRGKKSYYPLGQTAVKLAITYDLIYPLLSEKDRAKIRQGIMKNAVVNTYEDYFVDNRIPNHTSNHISHAVGGALLAVMAFYSEQEGNVEPYFSGLAEKLLVHLQATLKADGSYGEGYEYQIYTMATAWTVLAGLKSIFGVDKLADSLHLRRSYLFPLYISFHDGRSVLAMGDNRDRRYSSSDWAWLLHETRDPFLKWFYDPVRRQNWEDFLWLDESIPRKSPGSLPPSRVFPDTGNVVFRTGWSDEDVLVLYRAGPNYNHTHLDQGHFRLWAYGENLVCEAGYSRYYTDPYYWSYFTQSAGHNTILVDDNPESQQTGDFHNEVVAFRRHARIDNAFLSTPISWVTSELGMLYRDQLEQLTRKILFIDPGYLVVQDRIRSKSGPHHYTWQLFPPQKQGLEVNGDSALYRGRKAWLQVKVLSPRNPQLKIKDTPSPIREYAHYPQERLRPRSVLQVTHDEATSDQDFLVVLLPGYSAEQEPLRIDHLSGPGYQGVRILFNSRQDEIFFASMGEIKGPLFTDGSSAYLSRQGDALVAVSTQQATSLIVQEQKLLTASQPVDVALARDDSGETWWLQTEIPAQVWVLTTQPGRISIQGNGHVLPAKEGLQGIQLEAGQVQLRVEY